VVAGHGRDRAAGDDGDPGQVQTAAAHGDDRGGRQVVERLRDGLPSEPVGERTFMRGILADMLWAALALLGVPIWLVLGALAGATFNRHRFKSQPGVVPLLLRAADDDKWPRGLAYGRYVHNVLIVNHGLARIHTSVHVVEHVDRLDLGNTAFKHIDDPIAFAVRLDDGSEYELAIDRSDNPVEVSAEH